MASFRAVQYATLFLLAVFAVLVVALIAGVAVPRWAMVIVLATHAALRAYRDVRWGSPARRARVVPNLLVQAVMAFLILTVR